MFMETPAQVRREVTVTLANGLHMIPCSRIAAHVRNFEGTINVRLDNQTVDAKSVLDLMTLKAERGTVLVLEASGDKADAIVEELVRLFENDFELSG